MGTQKSTRKDKKKKGSQFVIRVDKTERDAFVALCDRLDTSAAREVRRFMRDRVAAHSGDTPASSSELASAIIADTAGDMATCLDAAPTEVAAVADTPTNDMREPKKKRLRQQHA